MITLKTERLTIRNFVISDWEALHDMINQHESSELAKYDHTWPTSAEEIKTITEWFASGDDYLAVLLNNVSRFIGFVSINQERKEDRREFSVGYIFNADYHGTGYATEACRAAIGHVFGRLQAQRVITRTAAANPSSWRLLERLGFRRTAESVGSFRNTPDGKRLEFVAYTYAISRDEWEGAVQRRSG